VASVRFWGVSMGVLGLLLLVVVRMLGERSFGITRSGRHVRRKGWCIVRSGKHRKSHSKSDSTARSFKQYMAETIWAYGAGVMAAHWPP